MNENRLKSAQSPPRSDWLDELLDPDIEAADVEAWSAAWSNWTELLQKAEPPSKQDWGEASRVRQAREQEMSGVPHVAHRTVHPYMTVALRGLIAAVAASLFLACSLSLSSWRQKERFATTATTQLGDSTPSVSADEQSDAFVTYGRRESLEDKEVALADAARALAAWEAEEAEVDWRLGRMERLLETWDHTMQPDDARLFFASQMLSSLVWELDQSGL